MKPTHSTHSCRAGQGLLGRTAVLSAVFALATLAVPTRSLAQAPTFNTIIKTNTGAQSFQHPSWSAAGDFNGDGKLDTIVTDGSSTLRVMVGQGTGAFSARGVGMPDLATGNVVDINPNLVAYLPKFIDGVGSIRAADVNGDGKLDAVAVVGAHINWGPYNFVAVLINTGNDANGTPQFAVTYYYSNFTDLRSLTVGDLNGDGKPEFIVGGAYAQLHVYVNNGNGTFTGLPNFSVVPSAGGPAVGAGVIADLNGDGKGDYAVTVNQGGALDVFFGNGDGTFQPAVVKSISATTSIAAADVNGDGKLDLLVGQAGAPNQLLVYLNAGAGSFSAPTPYSTGGTSFNGWTALDTADLNGDGKLDVVMTNSGNSKVAVLLGDGSGAFSAPTLFAVNATPLDLAVRDFNADGKLDIGTVGNGDNTYGVLTNTTVSAAPADTTPPVITAPADIVQEATGPNGNVVTFSATAVDDVDGPVNVVASPASGSTFPITTTVVGLAAADKAGNTATSSFKVTVQDSTAPVISSVSTNAPTLWPANHKMVAVTVNATASDLVGVASLKIVSVTSSEPDNGLGDGDTAGDIEITGAMTLNLRAERSGSGNGRTYTITVQATDGAGNASTKTVTVSVPKSQGK